MREFLLILGSYLIGSLNSAIILSRIIKNADIRRRDHAGASGAFRQFGSALGITVLVLDLAKGALIGFACRWFLPDPNTWAIALAGFALIAGHDWPLYFNFSGGGGLASGFGFVLTILPLESAVLGAFTVLLALLFWKSPLAALRLDRPIPTATIIAIPIFFVYIWIRYGFLWFGLMILLMGLAIMTRRIRTTWTHRKRNEPTE